MDLAKHTDLLSLLPSLGYTLKRVGSYYTTAEMDSIRIKERLTWKRYSTGQGGDAITFLQEFCGMRFPEAVDYISGGKLDLKPLITHRFPLDRYFEALDVNRDDPTAIKVVIFPDEA